MKYKLIFDFVTKPNLHFDLQVLDHPGARRFHSFFGSYPVAIRYHKDVWPEMHKDREKMQPTLDFLKNTFYQCKHKFGLSWDFTIPANSNDIDQGFLNLAHRFFTSNAHLNNENYAGSAELGNLLFDINHSVHRLECYLGAVNNDFGNTQKYLSASLSRPQVVLDKFDKKKLHKNQLTFTTEERQHHSAPDQHHDLVLATNILGKTVRESYWADDDPNHWDTSGHYVSFGECVLWNGEVTKTIYTGDKFAAWMKKRNTSFDKLKLDYPVADFSTSADRDRWLNYINGITPNSDDKAVVGEMIAK